MSVSRSNKTRGKSQWFYSPVTNELVIRYNN
jgi:hypothetical protein